METKAMDQHKNERSENHANHEQPAIVERRRFLAQAATIVGGGIAAAGLTVSTSEQVMAQVPVSINAQMKLVQRHENDHVATLLAVLGPSARPKPVFQNLDTTNLAQFLSLSRTLENTGVGAYLGATPAISDPNFLAAAGSIALVEARHAGLLNSLTSRAMTENVFVEERSFERALTVQEVVMLAGPFIANLNGGPPLTFSPARSAANDIAILNFALALEYLEAEFYNINVPRYYR